MTTMHIETDNDFIDPATLDAARQALIRLDAHKGENIHQWAAKLARDFVAAGESEYGEDTCGVEGGDTDLIREGTRI